MWTTDPKTNYRPCMAHLIAINMKKRSREKNINACKRLVGLLLLFSDGLAVE